MGFFQKIKNLRVVDAEELDRQLNISKADQIAMDSFNGINLDDDGRPSLGLPYLDTSTGAKYPLWRIPPSRLYWLAEEVSDFRVVIDNIRWEMFKNGIEIKPAFKYKCQNCYKEFMDAPSTEYISMEKMMDTKNLKLECDECGNKDEDLFKTPDPVERRVLVKFVNSDINDNMQNLFTIAEQVEYDLDVVDSSYTLVSKDYKVKKLDKPDPITKATKKVTGETLREMVRINPSTVSLIADDDGKLGMTRDRKPAWICPNYAHRHDLLAEPRCGKCGTEAFTAFLETSIVPFGPPVSNVKRTYYTRDEVIWIPSKYRPDLLYGVAPAVAIWKKVLSLYNQDEYLWKYFDKNRPPKSLLIMGSRNSESVKAFWKRNQTGAAVDPYMPRPILLNTENVKSAIEHVDITPNFKELEMSSMRNELRRAIAALFGVQPLFLGESSGQSGGSRGGGQNALQFTATNRRIKAYQKFIDENFFLRVTTNILKINDWKIKLVESEEVDKLRELQTKGVEADNAVKMYGMGFDVRTDGNGKLRFSQFPNPERQKMMMGGMGGTGSNIAQGKNDKTKDTKPKEESQTDFDGEPLENRQSDPGGIAGGGPEAGASFGNKMNDIIRNGLVNNWTITHMAKALAAETGVGQDFALSVVKKTLGKGVA